MENYAAKARLPARETIVFHHLLFPHARSRFLCKRTAATRRAWSKSNQLNFEFPVTLAAFFHSPFRLYPRIFPSIIASPRLMRLKCVSKISSLIFFKKARPDSKFLIEGEGKIIPSNDRREKKSEARTTNFKYYSYLLNCYCYEKHIFLFFFFFRIRGENDPTLQPASRTRVCDRASHISRNWPVNPVRDSNDISLFLLFLWTRFDSKLRNFEPTNRSTLLIFRNRVVNARMDSGPEGGKKANEGGGQLLLLNGFRRRAVRFIAPPLITLATNVTNRETARSSIRHISHSRVFCALERQ